PVEARDRPLPLSELEQDFPEAREGVLVIGVERHRVLEFAPRPRKLLARQSGIAHPDMQLDGMRIEPQALAEGLDGLVVLSFVVELMRAFVVVVGAEERIRHRTVTPGKVEL